MTAFDELHIRDPQDYQGHEGRIALTCGGEIAHRGAEPGLLWHHRVLEDIRPASHRLHFLGHYNGEQVFALDLTAEETRALAASLSGLREFLGTVPDGLFRLLGRALQINDWYSAHRHCGYCGGLTQPVPNERAMGCPGCAKVFYPRLSPCIMALVYRGEECLLARNSNWKGRRFSVVAGFIEPGESAEAAVHREVMEEVGVRVSDVEYFSSQPWPFPGQLMLGFFARYAGGPIQVDGDEIAEAHWYHHTALPQIPGEYALSGQLIRQFISRCQGSSLR